jgi:hypothetical protein
MIFADYHVTISWYYNGSYGGSGKYITNASVQASGSTLLGTKVNMSVAFGNPMNRGTDAAMIAAVPFTMVISGGNLLNSKGDLCEGEMRGSGGGTFGGGGCGVSWTVNPHQ